VKKSIGQGNNFSAKNQHFLNDPDFGILVLTADEKVIDVLTSSLNQLLMVV